MNLKNLEVQNPPVKHRWNDSEYAISHFAHPAPYVYIKYRQTLDFDCKNCDLEINVKKQNYASAVSWVSPTMIQSQCVNTGTHLLPHD